MIDLNTLISNALIAAVQQAVAPLNERIATLESDLARAVSVVEQRTERIAALETKLTEANLFTQMTPATITADAFVTHLDQQEWFWHKIAGFVTSNSNTTDITRHIIDALGDTEHPLFKRLSSFMDAVAEQAMDDHCSTYDHDSYDNAVSDLEDRDFDEFMTSDNLNDAINEALEQATIRISI